MKLNITNEMFSRYANLNNREIVLSTTGMTSRVFNYCKNNKIIDYELNLAPGKRGRVKLNYFEAFWVMIVQEFRGFGMSDRFILDMKGFFFRPLIEILEDNKIEVDEILNRVKENEDLSEERKSELTEDYFNELMSNAPEEEFMFTTYLGSLIGGMLLSDEEPEFNIFFNKNPETSEEMPYVFLTGNLVVDVPSEIHLSTTSIHLPLKKIFSSIFDLEISDQVLNHFRLLSDRESQIVSLIRAGDFKECVITIVNGEPAFKIKNEGEITGDQVKEIRKILGMKDYKNINLKFRNNKHIYYECER